MRFPRENGPETLSAYTEERCEATRLGGPFRIAWDPREFARPNREPPVVQDSLVAVGQVLYQNMAT